MLSLFQQTLVPRWSIGWCVAKLIASIPHTKTYILSHMYLTIGTAESYRAYIFVIVDYSKLYETRYEFIHIERVKYTCMKKWKRRVLWHLAKMMQNWRCGNDIYIYIYICMILNKLFFLNVKMTNCLCIYADDIKHIKISTKMTWRKRLIVTHLCEWCHINVSALLASL